MIVMLSAIPLNAFASSTSVKGAGRVATESTSLNVRSGAGTSYSKIAISETCGYKDSGILNNGVNSGNGFLINHNKLYFIDYSDNNWRRIFRWYVK